MVTHVKFNTYGSRKAKDKKMASHMVQILIQDSFVEPIN
jgi:hypothetical protein